MQKLYFEPAWDKTIAPVDREKIIHHFQTRNLEKDIHLSFLWEAINHKGEQLVTVLIHNPIESPLFLKDTVITYHISEDRVATGIFCLPLEVPKKSSMPWTFIFSPANKTTQTSQYTIFYES